LGGPFVIPAKAGIQGQAANTLPCGPWIPAFEDVKESDFSDFVEPD
jgi:hypothetical protein